MLDQIRGLDIRLGQESRGTEPLAVASELVAIDKSFVYAPRKVREFLLKTRIDALDTTLQIKRRGKTAEGDYYDELLIDRSELTDRRKAINILGLYYATSIPAQEIVNVFSLPTRFDPELQVKIEVFNYFTDLANGIASMEDRLEEPRVNALNRLPSPQRLAKDINFSHPVNGKRLERLDDLWEGISPFWKEDVEAILDRPEDVVNVVGPPGMGKSLILTPHLYKVAEGRGVSGVIPDYRGLELDFDIARYGYENPNLGLDEYFDPATLNSQAPKIFVLDEASPRFFDKDPKEQEKVVNFLRNCKARNIKVVLMEPVRNDAEKKYSEKGFQNVADQAGVTIGTVEPKTHELPIDIVLDLLGVCNVDPELQKVLTAPENGILRNLGTLGRTRLMKYLLPFSFEEPFIYTVDDLSDYLDAPYGRGSKIWYELYKGVAGYREQWEDFIGRIGLLDEKGSDFVRVTENKFNFRLLG